MSYYCFDVNQMHLDTIDRSVDRLGGIDRVLQSDLIVYVVAFNIIPTCLSWRVNGGTLSTYIQLYFMYSRKLFISWIVSSFSPSLSAYLPTYACLASPSIRSAFGVKWFINRVPHVNLCFNCPAFPIFGTKRILLEAREKETFVKCRYFSKDVFCLQI